MCLTSYVVTWGTENSSTEEWSIAVLTWTSFLVRMSLFIVHTCLAFLEGLILLGISFSNLSKGLKQQKHKYKVKILALRMDRYLFKLQLICLPPLCSQLQRHFLPICTRLPFVYSRCVWVLGGDETHSLEHIGVFYENFSTWLFPFPISNHFVLFLQYIDWEK